MILADTHAWVWALLAPQELSATAARALAEASVVGVSVMSCWEVATLASGGRINLGMDAHQWIHHALTRKRVEVWPVTTDIAVAAGSFGSALHGDPVDRIIAATAIHHQCPLITRDEKLRAFDSIESVW